MVHNRIQQVKQWPASLLCIKWVHVLISAALFGQQKHPQESTDNLMPRFMIITRGHLKGFVWSTNKNKPGKSTAATLKNNSKSKYDTSGNTNDYWFSEKASSKSGEVAFCGDFYHNRNVFDQSGEKQRANWEMEKLQFKYTSTGRAQLLPADSVCTNTAGWGKLSTHQLPRLPALT